jgi:hypothetical protein
MISSFPVTLHRAAVGVHTLLAAYLVVNGAAHQGAVLWKARAGTLPAGAHLASLLAVGSGLLVAGAAISFSIAPLVASGKPQVLPALAAALLFAGIIAAIAHRYGFRFLMGSITLCALDIAVLAACLLWRRAG